jgi:hypothetical protein
MGLLIGIVVCYFVYPATNPTQSISTTQLPSIIKIGALLSLSGTIKSYGETQKAALQLAQIDINNWLATVRPGVQLYTKIQVLIQILHYLSYKLWQLKVSNLSLDL